MVGQMTIFDFMQPEDIPDVDDETLIDSIIKAEILKGNNKEDGISHIFKIIDKHRKHGGDPHKVVEKIKFIFLDNKSECGRYIYYKDEIAGYMQFALGGLYFDFFNSFGQKVLIPWQTVAVNYMEYYGSGELHE